MPRVPHRLVFDLHLQQIESGAEDACEKRHGDWWWWVTSTFAAFLGTELDVVLIQIIKKEDQKVHKTLFTLFDAIISFYKCFFFFFFFP